MDVEIGCPQMNADGRGSSMMGICPRIEGMSGIMLGDG